MLRQRPIWSFASIQGFVIRCPAREPAFRVRLFLGSSAVEHSTVNRMVAGSNPARGASKFRDLASFSNSAAGYISILAILAPFPQQQPQGPRHPSRQRGVLFRRFPDSRRQQSGSASAQIVFRKPSSNRLPRNAEVSKARAISGLNLDIQL